MGKTVRGTGCSSSTSPVDVVEGNQDYDGLGIEVEGLSLSTASIVSQSQTRGSNVEQQPIQKSTNRLNFKHVGWGHPSPQKTARHHSGASSEKNNHLKIGVRVTVSDGGTTLPSGLNISAINESKGTRKKFRGY